MMKSPGSLGELSSLPAIDHSLFSGLLGEELSEQKETLEVLLNRMSQLFHIDMNYFDSGFVVLAVHERMQATNTIILSEYLQLLDSHATEANAVFRQIVSSPDWGLNMIAVDRLAGLKDLIKKTFTLDGKLRVWISRCGLGYNVINFLLLFEDILLERYGQCEFKGNYKVFATDVDYQLVKTANKLTIPSVYKDALYQGSQYQYLVEENEALISLKPSQKVKVNFAVHSHLQNHSLANIDLFVAVNLAQKLSVAGQQMLFQNIKKSLKPGGIILCDDPVLTKILSSSPEFNTIDSNQGYFQRAQAYQAAAPIFSTDRIYDELSRSVATRQDLPFVGEKHPAKVTKLFDGGTAEVQSLIRMKNDYIDLLHLEIDELYNQIQDMNEELSTSLEELETVNEELRISNDQLTTVNDQYSHKLEELSLYLKDYDQITDALNLGLLFVDYSKKIRFFNTRAESLLGLCLKDLNRCFSDFMFSKTLSLETLFFEVKNRQQSQSSAVSFKGISNRYIKAIPFKVQQVNCEGILFCIGDSDGMIF
ncbi:MAG: CheR family methyltransferase [Oligoflexus sp.]